MWTRRRAGNILTVEREDFSLINQNDLSIRFRIEHNIYLVLGRHSHSGETKQSGAEPGPGQSGDQIVVNEHYLDAAPAPPHSARPALPAPRWFRPRTVLAVDPGD